MTRVPFVIRARLAGRVARVLAACLLSVAPANADYLLQAGDRLRVTAAGVPDFSIEAVIDVDGRFRGPLIGSVPAAGATLDEMRESLARALAGQVLNRRLLDGEERGTVIEPTEIGVVVAEYRPVFVDGDVREPGEIPFRPGMTVRHALAAAGGIELLRVRAADPVLLQGDYRGEHERLSLELLRLETTRRRLASERAGGAEIDAGPALDPGGADGFAAAMADLEEDRFRARAESFAADREALDTALARLGERERHLVAQLEKQTAAAEADSAYEAESRANLTRGLVPMTRVVEAQRFASASAAQVREVAAEIAGVRREIAQLTRERTRLADERRLDVLRAVQDVEARIAEVRSRMRIVREQIAHVGGLSLRSPGRLADEASIVVHRGDGAPAADVGLDAALLPGDVVEITLARDLFGPRS